MSVLLFYPLDHVSEGITPDEWDAVARNLSEGRGYTVYAPQAGVYDWDLTGTPPAYRPTMRVPPVYPFVLAGIYGIAGYHPVLGQLAQILFDTLTAWVIYRIGWSMFDRRAGLLAAGFWAFYAPEVTYILKLRSEPLFTLLLCLWVWRAIRAPRSWTTGLLLGVVALCRPAMAGFGLAWGVYMAIRHRAVAPAASFIAILTPWLLWGFVRFGTPAPIASNGGYSLYRSVFAISQPDYITDRPPDFEAAYSAFRGMLAERQIPLPRHEVELDHLFQARAWELIRAHPFRYLHLSLENVARLWFRVYGGTLPGWKDAITCLFNTTLLAFMVVGLWRPDRRYFILPLVIIGYNTLFYALTLADPRYNTPIMPLIMVAGASGAMICFKKRQNR